MTIIESKNNIFMLVPESIQDQIDIGALCSRYSRTDKPILQIYKEEFLTNPNRGNEFYEKVLNQYGDESVQDMVGGGITICFENITILESTLMLCHRLIGAIEKSTRYVPLTIDNVEPEGKEQMQKFIDAFEKRQEELLEKHLEDTLDKALKNSIRSQALDETRHLIPLSAHTSLAITCNIREWIHILQSKLDVVDCIKDVKELLQEYYPVFFRKFDISDNPAISYIHGRVGNIFEPLLIDSRVDGLWFSENRKKKQKMSRRFEQYTFTFQIWCSIAVFRELHRHRFLSIYNVVFFGDNLTLGDNCTFFMHTNLRELVHLVELRTQPATHQDFRKLMLQLAEIVRKRTRYDDVKDIFKYMNTEQNIHLGRLKSEKKILGVNEDGL